MGVFIKRRNACTPPGASCWPAIPATNPPPGGGQCRRPGPVRVLRMTGRAPPPARIARTGPLGAQAAVSAGSSVTTTCGSGGHRWGVLCIIIFPTGNTEGTLGASRSPLCVRWVGCIFRTQLRRDKQIKGTHYNGTNTKPREAKRQKAGKLKKVT